jgi:hypothetical protein
MARRIAGMLARADAIRGVTALDLEDLRGWHIVIAGAVLLHLSPYGFDEGMRGRYAYTQDSATRCLVGLRRFAAVLDAWQATPERVWRLGDPDSAALALAAGELLGRPVEPWPADGSPAPGLIPCYDVAALSEETAASLGDHRPGQIVWSQASCWTTEPHFAADLTTYLYQHNVSPWGEGMRVNWETGKAGDAPASTAPPEERARAILDATVGPDDLTDLPQLVALARVAGGFKGEHAPGALLTEGRRRRQGANSPVLSSRFL